MSVKLRPQQQEYYSSFDDGIMRWLSKKNTEIISQRDLQEAVIIQYLPNSQGFEICSHLPREEVLVLYEKGLLNLIQAGSVERYCMRNERNYSPENRLLQAQFSEIYFEETSPQRGGAMLSSLELLARKSDRLGNHYLDGRMLRAAHQLFEDYEIGEVANIAAYNYSSKTWQAMIASFLKAKRGDEKAEARRRFAEVMNYLGNGLSDVVYRVCCLQEGLETAEVKLGWSARSAKVVLRIALLRVADFYQIPKSYKTRNR